MQTSAHTHTDRRHARARGQTHTHTLLGLLKPSSDKGKYRCFAVEEEEKKGFCTKEEEIIVEKTNRGNN